MEPDSDALGIERDLWSDAGAKGGISIPMARELSTTGDGLGSGPLLSIEESLRPPTLFGSVLGAQVVNIPSDVEGIAALGAAQASWIGAGSEATTTKMSTGLSLLGKHELQIRLAVSRRLRNQVADLESVIRSECRRATVAAVEKAVLVGVDPNEPTGLFNSAAIPVASVSAQPSRAELLAAVEPLLAIARPDEISLILPSAQFAELTGTSTPVIEPVDGMVGVHHLAGLRVVFTPYLSAGQSVAGAFQYLTIAYLGPIEPALADYYSQAASGQTIYTLFNTVGCAARQTGAFIRGVVA
jgi:HK97 family phage major capsid protein